MSAKGVDLSTASYYLLDGELHREDGPAVLSKNGDRYWYSRNRLHREGGPAVEFANGDKCWYYYEQKHRMDGPALELADGHKEWWIDGKRILCNSQREFERFVRLLPLA